MDLEHFKAGDLIEVWAGEGSPDFGVIRGVALDFRSFPGYANFRVKISVDKHGGDQVLHFNLNYVQYRRICTDGVHMHGGSPCGEGCNA